MIFGLLVVFCISGLILQAQIESRVQQCVCDMVLSRVCQCSVWWWRVTKMPTSWLQWIVMMLTTSRLAGVSYERLTLCRHGVEK